MAFKPNKHKELITRIHLALGRAPWLSGIVGDYEAIAPGSNPDGAIPYTGWIFDAKPQTAIQGIED